MLELLEQIEVAARKAACMGEEFRERGARPVEIMRELERIDGLADRIAPQARWEIVAWRLRQETENCGSLVARGQRVAAAARLDGLMHYAWGLCDAYTAEREEEA